MISQIAEMSILWHRYKEIKECILFSNLIFLVLVLLIVNLAPEANGNWWTTHPFVAFLEGILLYSIFLASIILLNFFSRFRIQFSLQRRLFLTNCGLVLFFLIYHFLLAAHRFYTVSWPAHTLISSVTLFLYFNALFLFHYTSDSRSSILRPQTPSAADSFSHLRFLLPFVLPFLLFGLIVDLLSLLPIPWIHTALNGHGNPFPLFLFTVAFMGVLLIIMPPLMVRIWQCSPLPKGEITTRLQSVCDRANFRCQGLLNWQVMRHSLTAAIVGVAPSFRYILFTEGLIERLPLSQVEAILAHEIGHSRRRHLLLYPFIIAGMLVLSGLFFFFFGPAISHAFSLCDLTTPSLAWRSLYPLAILLPTAIIIVLYFRFVFGYFSRLFERQADLHPIDLGMGATGMIDALDHVAIYSGNTHQVPSWHHWSVQQRIDFLERCRALPKEVDKHHRRVAWAVRCYFCLLTIAATLLVLPSLPENYPGYTFGKQLTQIGSQLDHWFNRNRRTALVDRLITEHNLNGNIDQVRRSLEYALESDEAQEIAGIAEYYGAQLLLGLGEIESSARLMTAAWKNFKHFDDNRETLEDFEKVTDRILVILSDGPTEQTLLRTMILIKYQLEQRKRHAPHDQQPPSTLPSQQRELSSRIHRIFAFLQH